jgi:hypothetical protein
LRRGVVADDLGPYLSPRHPAIVHRFPSTADNSRTMIASLLPRSGFLFSKGYAHGLDLEADVEPTTTMALLGYLNSYVCDWWVRRHVDRHVTGPIILGIPLPDWSRKQIERAARLAAAIVYRAGFRDMAGGITLHADDQLAHENDFEIRAELEGLVTTGFGLTRGDLMTVLGDFSEKEASCPAELRDLLLGD